MCKENSCGGKCHWVKKVAGALIIIGALNWGLVGFFGFDLVAAIFGSMSLVTRIVYILVGLSAVYKLVMHKHCCKGGACASSGNCADGACGTDTKADSCGCDHDHGDTKAM